jgi:uncharacterized protein YxjI
MPYTLQLRQRFTPVQNRYDLIGLREGREERLGYAEQKRLAIKEKITFFTDDAKTQVAFTMNARKAIELVGTYDVQDPGGAVLATLKKAAAASLLRSTYRVTLPDGRELVGQERSVFTALWRRVVDIPLFPIHFDVADTAGNVLVSVDRVMKIRDVYTIAVNDDTLDWRVAAALAVAFDAFMNR